MKVSAKTHIGLVREDNQDNFATGSFEDGTIWSVVCDGMGGAVGGGTASKIAVELISKRIEGCYNRKMKPSSVGNLLESAINLANIEIFDIAKENAELFGMGTTVVAAIITDDTVYVSHAGDSRAYISSPDELRQITVDHSVVQEMVDRGEITQEEAENHPIRNYITRALGVENSITVDFSYHDFKQDEKLLICTDGFSGFVSHGKIHELLLSDNDDIAEDLVEAAIEGGGRDNITVVTVKH